MILVIYAQFYLNYYYNNYNMNINDCINYNPSIFDFIILPYQILFKLCISVDKTKLIIVSLIRLILCIYLFNYLNSKKWIEWDINLIPQIIFYLMFAMYIITNVIYIIILLIKKPILDKDLLEKTAIETAMKLKKEQMSKPL